MHITGIHLSCVILLPFLVFSFPQHLRETKLNRKHCEVKSRLTDVTLKATDSCFRLGWFSKHCSNYFKKKVKLYLPGGETVADGRSGSRTWASQGLAWQTSLREPHKTSSLFCRWRFIPKIPLFHCCYSHLSSVGISKALSNIFHYVV